MYVLVLMCRPRNFPHISINDKKKNNESSPHKTPVSSGQLCNVFFLLRDDDRRLEKDGRGRSATGNNAMLKVVVGWSD